MDPVQAALWTIGAMLIVIGAINRRRKEESFAYFLASGALIFALGCLVLG